VHEFPNDLQRLFHTSFAWFASVHSERLTEDNEGNEGGSLTEIGVPCSVLLADDRTRLANTEGRMPFSLARFVPSVLPLRFLRLLLFNSESLTEDNEGNEGILRFEKWCPCSVLLATTDLDRPNTEARMPALLDWFCAVHPLLRFFVASV